MLDTTTLGNYDKSFRVRTAHHVWNAKTFLLYSILRYQLFSHTVKITQHPGLFNVFIAIEQQFVNPKSRFEVKLRLYVDDKNMKGALDQRDYIELDANLTSVSYGSNVGELVSVDVSFEANGPVIMQPLVMTVFLGDAGRILLRRRGI